MKAEFINPFITSATEVLQTECHVTVRRDGKPSLSTHAIASQEVTAIIGVTGKLEGVAVYSMSYDTALALFSEMMGEPVKRVRRPGPQRHRRAWEHDHRPRGDAAGEGGLLVGSLPANDS